MSFIIVPQDMEFQKIRVKTHLNLSTLARYKSVDLKKSDDFDKNRKLQFFKYIERSF
jgi:hypothetical protein